GISAILGGRGPAAPSIRAAQLGGLFGHRREAEVLKRSISGQPQRLKASRSLGVWRKEDGGTRRWKILDEHRARVGPRPGEQVLRSGRQRIRGLAADRVKHVRGVEVELIL